MQFLKKNLSSIFFVALLVVLPAVSFADIPCNPAAGKICPPINETTINGFIKTLLTGVIRIGIPVVALAVIYCGFLFVQARGKPEDLKKAKDALLYTLIGAAILLGSWAIAQLISETVLAL